MVPTSGAGESDSLIVLLRFIDRNRKRAKIAKIRMRFKNRESHFTSCVYKALRCNLRAPGSGGGGGMSSSRGGDVDENFKESKFKLHV